MMGVDDENQPRSAEQAEARCSEELEARRLAEEAARRSYGKLVAFLAVRTRNVAAAEDALSEAFASALTDWPRNGCPANPEAWLLTVARRKMIDRFRAQQRAESAGEHLRIMADSLSAESSDAEIPDRRLALMFACAHPAIESGIRAPLMLQVVLGLDAATIASAFLTSPAAMSKRLVRAKEKIRQAGIPFSIPGMDELPPRLDAVLDAIYAAYSKGWTDPTGTDPSRRDLAEEAIFLCRLVAELLPDQPEAVGLLALILHTEARRRARRNRDGEYVPLEKQDQTLWDWQKIKGAEELLRRAGILARPGRYQLEAALQSAHVYRCRIGENNWAEVVQLYDALLALSASPVIAVNRAVAIGQAHGPEAALDQLQALAADARLTQYQPYWAARADLLAKTGAYDEAREAYDVAIGLEPDPAVRRFLQASLSRIPNNL
jgi:RNA polymerase sigma-70 factor (ECF subfamily)